MRLLLPTLLTVGGLICPPQAKAFDPTATLVTKGVATALDVRNKDEVVQDGGIDSALTQKLLAAKGEDFKNVSCLVFARRVVLVGFAKDAEVGRKAEALAKGDKRIRALANAIQIGKAGGDMAHNAVLDKKIELTLEATQGVSSVNMRWKVYGGDVFLMGVAKSQTEATLAVKKIRGVSGVKVVHSSLHVGR